MRLTKAFDLVGIQKFRQFDGKVRGGTRASD
jgi:hypothetical protein